MVRLAWLACSEGSPTCYSLSSSVCLSNTSTSSTTNMSMRYVIANFKAALYRVTTDSVISMYSFAKTPTVPLATGRGCYCPMCRSYDVRFQIIRYIEEPTSGRTDVKMCLIRNHESVSAEEEQCTIDPDCARRTFLLFFARDINLYTGEGNRLVVLNLLVSRCFYPRSHHAPVGVKKIVGGGESPGRSHAG